MMALPRSGHFAAIRESATDGCEALTTWLVVRQAVKVLMDAKGLSEGDAYWEPRRRASEGRLTVGVVADEIIGEAGSS